MSTISVPSKLLPGSAIFFVGEAPGVEEENWGKPFVGVAGRELRRMTSQVGIDLDTCSVANVFSTRPPGNDVDYFFDGERGDTPFPALEKSKHLNKKWLPDIARLRQEIDDVKPNIVVALGRTPLLILRSLQGIGANRGVMAYATLLPVKCLATYHPAAILRQWSLRVIALADLQKAAGASAARELAHDASTIWINPTIEDLHVFERQYFRREAPIASDIETKQNQIECIGFAPSAAHAICVPFIKAGGSYWASPEQEGEAWRWVGRVLREYPIIFQNGGYDSVWCCRDGVPPLGYVEDTMLLHHALYPELPKGLGFLGSVYCNRPAWKLMRPAKAKKREE